MCIIKNKDFINHKGDKNMKGVQLTKLAQELNLTNLTPDIDLTEIYVKTAEILPMSVCRSLVTLSIRI